MKVSKTKADSTYSVATGKNVKLPTVQLYINVHTFKDMSQWNRVFKKIQKIVKEENK